MKLIPYDEARPLRSLLVVFVAWKAFLLAIALGTTVGHDYDTSTSLFFEHMYGPGVNASTLATKLTRWDSLYFMQAARDGYVYEQQWAFGAALPVAVQAVLRPLKALHLVGGEALEPLAAIGLASLAHLAAVLALHRLALVLFKSKPLAYVAAVLHILSPAGLFLSAPCPESPFVCLSFIGNLLFATGLRPGAVAWKRILAFLGAGISFGLATSFRSNGLMSGLLFAVEATKCLLAFLRHPTFSRLALLSSLIIGGLSIAAGSAVPQAVAWLRYCKGDFEPRPWCSRLVPSIYTFVQAHYWNNGFLRYWTPNQLPLFLLASPVLTLLIKSGLEVSFNSGRGLGQGAPVVEATHRTFLLTLAVIQTLVAILAITNFHVQIINRLSSGYPVWYWWVASNLSNDKTRKTGSIVVVFIIMYAGIQGGLFASFLPPA
ncbi:glycosyltransferase family 76 protein [Trichoderma cornu-damae]|uniref:GPI mannosyltransferase 2 n=1 Tax=Trichoderma cornu-damae TaxID=654480 RepID=A0A9P8QUH9_9HYPO|nr:glycosyltransferase family 76 protein [Trichoderma cornu-damae]